MTEKTEKNANLAVKLSTQTKNGVNIEVSTKCDTWELMQKFLSDFQNTLLKGNNGT